MLEYLKFLILLKFNSGSIPTLEPVIPLGARNMLTCDISSFVIIFENIVPSVIEIKGSFGYLRYVFVFTIHYSPYVSRLY